MFENPEARHYSVNEDEIRKEGQEKGLSEAEIESRIASEKARVESANLKASSEVEGDESERAIESLMRAFEERAKKDPEFLKKLEKLEEEEAA